MATDIVVVIILTHSTSLTVLVKHALLPAWIANWAVLFIAVIVVAFGASWLDTLTSALGAVSNRSVCTCCFFL